MIYCFTVNNVYSMHNIKLHPLLRIDFITLCSNKHCKPVVYCPGIITQYKQDVQQSFYARAVVTLWK